MEDCRKENVHTKITYRYLDIKKKSTQHRNIYTCITLNVSSALYTNVIKISRIVKSLDWFIHYSTSFLHTPLHLVQLEHTTSNVFRLSGGLEVDGRSCLVRCT